MKFSFFFFSLFTATLFAESFSKPIGYIAVKPAYFLPQDPTFRHLYKGGFIFLGEIGFYLTPKIFLSLESGYFHKKNKIQTFDVFSRSTIKQAPLSLTGGYIYPLYSFWDIYCKIGPSGIYTKTKVSIPNIIPEKNKYTAGFVIEAGAKFYFYKGLYSEIFCNYLYNRKKIHSSQDSFFVYLGGVHLGASLGYRF